MTVEMTILGKKSDYFQLSSSWKKVIQGDYCLYMCSSFGLLGFESRDFSQTEKERTTCKAVQTHKMTTVFTQNDNLGLF